MQTSGYNTGAATGASVRVFASASASASESGGGNISNDDGEQEVVLREGDGLYVMGDAGATLKFENMGERVAEVLLFDVE